MLADSRDLDAKQFSNGPLRQPDRLIPQQTLDAHIPARRGVQHDLATGGLGQVVL